MEHTGWLLDLFADPGGGVILWLLGDDGQRRLFRGFGSGSRPGKNRGGVRHQERSGYE